MCGIAGYSGHFSSALLKKMGLKQSHRGPDAEGVWFDDTVGVGLAHQRLAIIDLHTASNQPMWDNNHRFCISYNGEIYNYKDLRQELIVKGYAFRTHSDTEVILNLIQHYGTEGLSKLNGIFAFALWDCHEEALWLARDGAGVKPLYYGETPKGLVFASEIKALLEEPSLDKSLDLSAVQSHLTYLWCPGPNTMLASVKKLEPGMLLKVVQGKIHEKKCFYQLPAPIPNNDLTEEEAIDALELHLSTAVERQMVSDVPVGAFLSGGLDSSSLVHYAQNLQEAPLECFTIAFDEKESHQDGFAEDLPYAKQIAEHLGANLNIVTVGHEMAYDLEKMIYFLDEPQADPAPINALYIAQLAKEQGYKVLLSGAGGDDVFSGYRRHYAVQKEAFWRWLPKPLRSLLKKSTHMLPQNQTTFRRLAKAFQHADASSENRLMGYFEWIQANRMNALCGPAFEGRTLGEPSARFKDCLSDYPQVTSQLNQMLLLEQKHFLVDHNLNYTDKMAMAHSVEVRVPFLDPDLMDFAARLPINYKQRGREGKWLLKKCMERHLPKDAIYRSKTGFGAPIRQWLRGPLEPLMQDILSESKLSSRGLFNSKNVQSLIQADKSGKVDASYTLLSLICIEIWCDTFL